MSTEENNSGWDWFLMFIGINALSISLVVLAGWFAYLDNGYWGWPFVGALLCGRTVKTSEDKRKEEREAAIQRRKDLKKYGENFYN